MPPAPRHSHTNRRSRQGPLGAPEVPSSTPQDNGSFTVTFGNQQLVKQPLLQMPDEIIANILIEWTTLDWFAPAIARQICYRLKAITDSNPRVWSKLFLPSYSRATAHDVRGWIRCAKGVLKEIFLQTGDIYVASAALEGAKDSTSLIYRIPIFDSTQSNEQELIRLPRRMAQLRHLYLNAHQIHNCIGVVGLYDTHFPCLTILHLRFANLIGSQIMSGLFPAIRRLVLEEVCGPILDLVQVCSESLEDLRISVCFSYHQQSLHGIILLPNLKVLVVIDSSDIVSHLDVPTVRLICADLEAIHGTTRPFPSVVKWATSESFIRYTDITDHLINMPQLQHLVLFQKTDRFQLCFESLRDNPSICPSLQSIEVVEECATRFRPIQLGADFKKFLKDCVAWRAEKGLTLQFVEDDIKLSWYALYIGNGVCLFIVMRHHLSYNASSRTGARSKAR
jgi:hypothetical protein